MKQVLFSFFGVVFTLITNAQIVYTDINDVTLSTQYSSDIRDSYLIDLDNNGVIDYTLSAFDTSGAVGFGVWLFTGAMIEFKGSNKVAGYIYTEAFGNEYIVVDTISSGLAIDGALNYVNLNDALPSISTLSPRLILPAGGLGSQYNGVPEPEFIDAGDQYIGVEFKKGVNTHYGWVRVNLPDSCSTVTIKDFAYNSTPNTVINAGDNGVYASILDNETQDVKVVLDNNLGLTILNLNGNIDIELFDVLGKRILNKNINSNSSLSLKGLKTGVYIVNVNSYHSQKIYIK